MVGYISHQGLSGIMNTLQETVQPDYREKDIQSLLYHISDSENSVRIFTIIRESKYLDSYHLSVEKSKNAVVELKEKSNQDPYLLHQLDTIYLLLQQKINTQNRLIQLSRGHRNINVYEEVLLQVQLLTERNETIDSLQKSILTAEYVLEKEIAAKEAELQSQKSAIDENPGFFKSIFGPGKKRKEQIQQQILEIETRVNELDSLMTTKDALVNIADTLDEEDITSEIQLTLLDIKNRELQIFSEMAEMELRLTRNDYVIRLEIQKHIEKVKRYFGQLDISQAREASTFFDKISRQITIVGTVFSMLFIVMIIVVLHDIQVQQRYRKKLEFAKDKAEKLTKAKDDFLSNVSHEIRTPLNAIMGFIDQLKGSGLRAGQQKHVSIIKNASDHLLGLINDILDFAKIESGKIKLEKIPFSIEKQSRIVFDTLHKKAADKCLQFTLEIDESAQNSWVIGDPVRFRQIIFNLVDNAIKFTDEGFVKLFVAFDQKFIQIKVADSGIGIPEKYQKTIFEKFDQVSEDATKMHAGTGLGLSIVKKLVILHIGTISVDSLEGQGTTFTIRLPYAMAKEEDLENIDKQMSPALRFEDNISVLIVDDEEYNRVLIETVFDKHKINNQTAKSGMEALQLLKKYNYDIVLLDLQMEGLSGFDVAARIKAEKISDAPLVAVTATASQNIKTECKRVGIEDVLIKPISESTLLTCLYKHIASNSKKQGEVTIDIKPSKDPFQGNTSVAEKMTNIYRKSLGNAISNMEESVKSGDYEVIKKEVHRIIPSSRHMGSDQFAEQLKALESSIENGRDRDELNKEIQKVLSKANDILLSLEKPVLPDNTDFKT